MEGGVRPWKGVQVKIFGDERPDAVFDSLIERLELLLDNDRGVVRRACQRDLLAGNAVPTAAQPALDFATLASRVPQEHLRGPLGRVDHQRSDRLWPVVRVFRLETCSKS